ncbi:MAG: Uma2 family endonuclease [Anaerolineales bacterium]|nr:Uma2 family endonuclease [Anaerolineales bacterium]
MTLAEKQQPEVAPVRQSMDYETYLATAGESQIMEWKEGEVITYMPPLDVHQDLVQFLSHLLNAFVQTLGLGIVRFAPLEVKLWPDGPSREPDVLFVSTVNRDRLTAKRFVGGPDLVIEIVSPSSVTADRVDKFREYERAGVREYWLIDPRPHQEQAEFYVLGEDGAYYPAPIAADGVYHATILPGFWLQLDWLRQPELPNPQRALAAILLALPDLSPELRSAYQTIYEALGK